MTRDIEADDFARALGEILDNVAGGVRDRLPDAVNRCVRVAAKEWRGEAKDLFGGHTRGKNANQRTYRKHGETYVTGAYARSIRSHMTDTSPDHPAGEAGSPKMPGLPHLLEFGHAKVGGGRVNGIPHVSTAADVAFREAGGIIGDAVQEALDDA